MPNRLSFPMAATAVRLPTPYQPVNRLNPSRLPNDLTGKAQNTAKGLSFQYSNPRFYAPHHLQYSWNWRILSDRLFCISVVASSLFTMFRSVLPRATPRAALRHAAPKANFAPPMIFIGSKRGYASEAGKFLFLTLLQRARRDPPYVPNAIANLRLPDR